jgi:hypothetical protein
MNTTLTLPVWRDTDVLVIGASTAAVAAALEAVRRGSTALAVSDLSYFGEETAGTLHLWPAGLDRADPLVAAMFGPGDAPARPAAIKRALETALLAAAVPFLFRVRPVALLRDPAGRVAGTVLAARTALFAVRCRAIVDASRHGLVARLAGLPTSPRVLPPTVSWTVLSNGAPADWPHAAEEIRPPYRQTLKDGERTFGAYRLTVDRAALGGDPAAAEHALRATLVADNVCVSADLIPDPPAVCCGSADGGDPARLPDASLRPAAGLVLANGLLPLDLAGAALLERADVQAALGRRAGTLAAAHARAQPPAGSGDLCAQTGGDRAGVYGFAPVFLRRNAGSIALPLPAFPALVRCDVAVVGGGTGGAPAAIAAARDGAKTVLLETQHALGGVGTAGYVSSYYFGNRVGFTAELDEAVMRVDADSRKDKGRRWNPEVKSGVYSRLLHDAGGAAWFGSYAFGVRRAGSRVDALLVSTPFGAGVVETGCVVDATGDADVPAAAGVPCRVMGADHVATQGTGLSPRVHPGVRAQNSDHTFIDETDPEGITHAFVHARAKYPNDFDTSSLVNSRERRQTRADYEVTPLDILAGRTFPDTVFTAASNFDTHGFIVHPLFMAAEPDHVELRAHVPFRCLLPQGLDGVLVTGLGMGAHRDALPVIRMQADVQNQGYAAGLAAATAARSGQALRALEVRALQRRLAALGILAPDVPTHEDSFPVGDAAIRAAAADDLRKAMNAAVLFAHPAQSRPLLLAALRTDAARRLDAALLLGLMGCREAAPALAEAVQAHAWDQGWNYRGMGQFGPSLSRLDTLIVALGRTGDPAGVPAIEAKIRALTPQDAFSHSRAVAVAAAQLRDARLAPALAALLRQPGMGGHAQVDTASVCREANGDPIETESRNLALRELHLARGLFLAGDVDGLGRAILEAYARDLRGHFARHARAVLEGRRGEDAMLA